MKMTYRQRCKIKPDGSIQDDGVAKDGQDGEGQVLDVHVYQGPEEVIQYQMRNVTTGRSCN